MVALYLLSVGALLLAVKARVQSGPYAVICTYDRRETMIIMR